MSLYDNRRQWAALPMGELHPFGECAYCGTRGEVDKDLKRTVLVSTHAMACVCVDMVACIRRRRQRKNV